MNTIYEVSSFISFIGLILFIVSPDNEVEKLSLVQKIAIILFILGMVVPFISGVIELGVFYD